LLPRVLNVVVLTQQANVSVSRLCSRAAHATGQCICLEIGLRRVGGGSTNVRQGSSSK
jgi:hypothetical protein